MFNECSHIVMENIRENNKEFWDKKLILKSLPINIQFSPTERCNLNCFHCYRQKWKEELIYEDMDVELLNLESVNIAVSKAQTAWIVSGGEPLVYKNFSSIVSFLYQHNVNKVYTITNGTIINEELADYFVKVGFSNIKISIDGFNAETIDKVRGKNVHKKIIEGINLINKYKQKYNLNFPRIILNFVLMKLNFHELPDLIKFAEQLKVDSVEAHHCQNLNDNVINMSLYDCPKDFNNIILTSKEVAKEYNIDFTHPPLFDSYGYADAETSQYELCKQPWDFFLINQTGDVYPCCYLWDNPFGNVFNQSYEDIWNGDAFIKLREESISNGMADICLSSTCPKVNNFNKQFTSIKKCRESTNV